MKLKLTLIIFSLMLLSCGFKVVDQNYLKNIEILETNITGDKRVAYLLRNKLKTRNSEGSRSIKLNIEIKKIKQIKEKNIQNEVTKYEIIIITDVKFDLIEENKSEEFTVSKKNNFNVADQYSGTLNNEKNLIKNLINDIADDIIENLAIRIDDL